MRITKKNTATKSPQWVYFQGHFDLCFDNGRTIFCDALQEATSNAIIDTRPYDWMECQDVYVEESDGPRFSVVFPMTVGCRIEATRAANISDTEVCMMLQQALEKMVKGLVRGSDSTRYIRHFLKCARKVTLTGVTRQYEPDEDYTFYLKEILGYDLADAQSQPAETSVKTDTGALSKQQ